MGAGRADTSPSARQPRGMFSNVSTHQKKRTFAFATSATALALAVAMLGTTLPTPLYALYREQFGLSELMITVIFATYAVGVIASTIRSWMAFRSLFRPSRLLS